MRKPSAERGGFDTLRYSTTGGSVARDDIARHLDRSGEVYNRDRSLDCARDDSVQARDDSVQARDDTANAARTALPDYTGVTYTVTATKAGYTGDPVTWTGATLDYSIAIPETGTWTLTATAQKDADPPKVFATGTTEIEISETTPSVTDANIQLAFVTGGSVSGSVYLTMSFPGIDVHSVKYSWNNGSEDNLTVRDSSYCILDLPGITPGSYVLRVSFYDSSDVLLYAADESVIVLPGLTTSVWSGHGPHFETSGGTTTFNVTDDAIKAFSQKTFYVSGTGGEMQTACNAAAGNDTTGDGTWQKPFQTVSKAVEHINTIGDGTSEYTIYVDGTVLDSYTSNEQKTVVRSFSGNASKSVIKSTLEDVTNQYIFTMRPIGAKDLTLINITLDANHHGGCVNIPAGKFTAKGCVFKNGDVGTGSGGGIKMTGGTCNLEGTEISACTATNGGGIYVSVKGASLTLSTGVNVTANTASGNGGGVYFAGTNASGGTANLIMQGTAKIGGNTATNCGGGVYLSYANLCMSGSALIGETGSSITSAATSGSKSNSAASGGGIYLATGGKLRLGYASASATSGTTLSADYGVRHNYASNMGGGIYANGDVDFASGAISYNGTAAGSGNHGGGIYTYSGTFTMSGGTIAKNKGYYGGGIYCGGTVNVGGTAVIKGNSANRYGGGAFIEYGKTLTFEGGTIGGSLAADANSAEQGGGIYVSGALSMTDGVISGNTVTEHGGGLYATGTTELSGGIIESNSASGMGGGIFMNNGDLILGGSITVPIGSDKKNDLYLSSGKTIELSTPLTSSNVATITPAEYADGTPILSLAEPSSTSIPAERAKFKIKQTEQLDIFDISNTGYLTTVMFSFDETFTNGTVYGTETYEGKKYAVIKYRYTQYNNLFMNVTNPYADIGWDMEFKLDDETTDPASATTLSDGYHTLSATLAKGSESVTATTRVHAMIKPVTVTVPKVKGFITRGDGYRISLDVELYIQGLNGEEYTEKYTIAHWTGVFTNDLNGEYSTNSTNSVILTSPDSTFYFFTSDSYDAWLPASIGKINRGFANTTRTLRNLKNNGRSFDSGCVNSDGNSCADSGRRSHYWFTVTLNDD